MIPTPQPHAASLSFGRPDLIFPVLLAGIILFALTYRSQRHLRISQPRKAAVLFLKCLVFVLLLTCFVEPRWTTRVPKERANTVALLLDDSQSMQLPDTPAGGSRGEHLLSLWTEGGSEWRFALEKYFRARAFTFATGLREMTSGQLPSFQGSSSRLGSCLLQLADRIGQTPAGVVVFTDGVCSDLNSMDFKALPPVYPVIFGDDKTEAGTALGPVTVTQGAFEDAPVTINAEVRATHMNGESVSVLVESFQTESPQPGSAIAQTTLKVQGEHARTTAQLQFTPDRSGPTLYKVTVQPEADAAFGSPHKARNTRLLCINRPRGPHPILYVAGRPNWEFPPLRRALDGDPELQLRALVRIAKREPKFQFKGRGGEATNPLFRGFQSESGTEVQRYDQPVIVRINVESPGELVSGFPKTAEELYSYKALIIDHLEAEFFSTEQHRLLQRFVSERGGGLLMLGGMESYRSGGWQGTPLETALPVWLGKDAAAPGESYQWQLTRDGLLQPWMRSRKSEADETARTKSLPALEVLNSISGAKPAATVQAIAATLNASHPALVTQRYGLGRCAALMTGDLYRWGIGDPTNAADLAKWWRQTARWLASEAPNPVELTGHWDSSSGLARLQVRLRDQQARPVDDADVTVRVRRFSDGPAAGLEFHAEPSGEPGIFSVSNTFPAEGGWLAEAVAVSGNGTEIGRSDFGWVQDQSEMEWRSLTPDLTAMTELARLTGGEVIRPEDLNQLQSRLRDLPNLTTEIRTQSLWHNGVFFILALLSLIGEWFLRRQSGAS